MIKICKKCNIEKDINLFYKHKAVCKECISESRKLEYLKDKERIKEKTKKYYRENIDICREKGKKYYHENKNDLYKKSRSEYYEMNKEKIKEKRKVYIKNNREKVNKKQKSYQKDRRKKDNLFKLSTNVRNLINNTFYRFGFSKKSKTYEILGCSFEEFKLYLESKFEPWMNWDNRGLYNGELNYGWDLDHIIPISEVKSEEEVIKLNHYTNFQPMCSYINRAVKRNTFQEN